MYSKDFVHSAVQKFVPVFNVGAKNYLYTAASYANCFMPQNLCPPDYSQISFQGEQLCFNAVRSRDADWWRKHPDSVRRSWQRG